MKGKWGNKGNVGERKGGRLRETRWQSDNVGPLPVAVWWPTNGGGREVDAGTEQLSSLLIAGPLAGPVRAATRAAFAVPYRQCTTPLPVLLAGITPDDPQHRWGDDRPHSVGSLKRGVQLTRV